MNKEPSQEWNQRYLKVSIQSRKKYLYEASKKIYPSNMIQLVQENAYKKASEVQEEQQISQSEEECQNIATTAQMRGDLLKEQYLMQLRRQQLEQIWQMVELHAYQYFMKVDSKETPKYKDAYNKKQESMLIQELKRICQRSIQKVLNPTKKLYKVKIGDKIKKISTLLTYETLHQDPDITSLRNKRMILYYRSKASVAYILEKFEQFIGGQLHKNFPDKHLNFKKIKVIPLQVYEFQVMKFINIGKRKLFSQVWMSINSQSQQLPNYKQICFYMKRFQHRYFLRERNFELVLHKTLSLFTPRDSSLDYKQYELDLTLCYIFHLFCNLDIQSGYDMAKQGIFWKFFEKRLKNYSPLQFDYQRLKQYQNLYLKYRNLHK